MHCTLSVSEDDCIRLLLSPAKNTECTIKIRDEKRHIRSNFKVFFSEGALFLVTWFIPLSLLCICS